VNGYWEMFIGRLLLVNGLIDIVNRYQILIMITIFYFPLTIIFKQGSKDTAFQPCKHYNIHYGMNL